MLTVQPHDAAGQVLANSLGEYGAFLYLPSTEMARVLGQVRMVAPQDTTVLLTGETGTGKTHLARLIHELSPRRGLPFMVVNCGALSQTLIESELFGHVKGSFTGADRDRVGKFQEAGAGTLVLDEVDALPLALQAKLLRTVEERVFEPVGSNRSQRVHARLIAASNRSLEREVEAGRFRSDLYYRLNVVGFTLPPLRDRGYIIGPIANQYISEFSAKRGREVRSLSPQVLSLLERYPWPGNVRELRNVVERAVALCPSTEITLNELPETILVPQPSLFANLPPSAAESRRPVTGGSLANTTAEAEIARIMEVLAKHHNNRLRTALELGISRMTLYKKLHKYGLMGAA
jgi:two-component system response regulator HydG